LYSFGQFVLDSRKRTLSRADSPVSLTPKAFDVLLFLAQNPNRLVTKEELLPAVWGDTFVEEGNLTQYISHLRKALEDNSEDTRLIVTIARKDISSRRMSRLPKRQTPQNKPRVKSPPSRVPQMRRFQKRQRTGGKLRSWVRLPPF
jgi:DNA-binding winged helix-turn-helix (wHTH) protein